MRNRRARQTLKGWLRRKTSPPVPKPTRPPHRPRPPLLASRQYPRTANSCSTGRWLAFARRGRSTRAFAAPGSDHRLTDSGRRHRMRRRAASMHITTFIAVLMVLLAAPALVVPLAAEAQQAARVWRIGVLAGTPPDAPRWRPFRERLREFGYVEGQNIAFDWRL